MQNPERGRNWAIGVLVIAAGVMVAGITMPESEETYHRDSLRLARLKRGEGVIGRWMIDPTVWRTFVESSREWDRQKGVPLNSLDTYIKPSAEGVEVIVSEEGICVAGDFTAMGKMPPVRISGAVMEMDLVYYNRNATQRRNVYRFPIALGAARDAERIQQFFQRREK